MSAQQDDGPKDWVRGVPRQCQLSLRPPRSCRPDRRVLWSLVVVMLASTPPAAHTVLVGGGRFDLMVSKAEVIVRARVTKIVTAPFERIAFEGTVLSTLKTDGKPVPKTQSFGAPAPLWPTELGLEFREGQLVLLVLTRKGGGGLNIVNNLGAVLPAAKHRPPDNTKRSPEKSVFLELRSLLEETTDALPLAKVLVLLSHVASKDDLEVFASYAASRDPWIRRGAYAAMARLDPSPSRISPIVRDFEVHLENPEMDHVFWDIYTDIGWASRCGDFGMDEHLTSQARAYLPVYRILLDRAPQDCRGIDIGIEALKNVGTREDLGRLYRFHAHPKAWVRHEVLEGLGRILGKCVKRPMITSYEMPLPAEVAPWENAALAELEPMLRAQGIIEESSTGRR